MCLCLALFLNLFTCNKMESLKPLLFAVVAGNMLSFVVTDMVSTYKPSEVIIARVGDVKVELLEVTGGYYNFIVATKLANLGTEPLVVSGGDIVVMIDKGYHMAREDSEMRDKSGDTRAWGNKDCVRAVPNMQVYAA